MSWHCQNQVVLNEDWNTLLTYGKADSALFAITRVRDERRADSSHYATYETTSRSLTKDQDWESLADHRQHEGKRSDNHVSLLLFGTTGYVAKLPCSGSIFAKVRERWNIHVSIARVINRNLHSSFTTMRYRWPSQSASPSSIVYNCRTTDAGGGSMALSVTFFPESLTTQAVWYGCDMKGQDKHDHLLTDYDVITRKLCNFDGSVFHPMLLPVFFADMERERHKAFVKTNTVMLIRRVNDSTSSSSTNISNTAPKSPVRYSRRFAELLASFQRSPISLSVMRGWRTLWSNRPPTTSGTVSDKEEAGQSNIGSSSPHSQNEPPRASPQEGRSQLNDLPSAKLWFTIGSLINQLKAWQGQLRRMIEHIEELESQGYGFSDHTSSEDQKMRLEGLQDCGQRIKQRLKDLLDEYDDLIGKCRHSMDGMSLMTQLELNRIGQEDARTNRDVATHNLEVASRARQDGYLMRTIAVLGMIFLPATFVSTFFSMDFFDFSEDGMGVKAHPAIWIYFVVVSCLTLLTCAGFYVFALHKMQRMSFDRSTTSSA